MLIGLATAFIMAVLYFGFIIAVVIDQDLMSR